MRPDGVPVFVQDGVAAELKRVAFSTKGDSTFDERWLQKLIHEHPQCLPMREIEPGFRELTGICMELPTKHGFVDNLMMTSDGNIVLAEAKLWRNPEARRKVVGQALDYAACLFEMDYEDLEAAVLQADFGARVKPHSLIEVFPESERPLAAQFVDAVNFNLRHGRIVVLVVGDGIRTEAERLSASLQSHAGLRFTFALVELAVFEGPFENAYVVHPRTLAKTCMIERGVVHVDDKRTTISPPVSDPTLKAKAESITSEQFFESMALLEATLPEKLKTFLERLADVAIYPDYQRSLNIKWDPPVGKPVNLAYVLRNGEMWTDAANWQAPHDLSHKYQEELAALLGGEVEKVKLGSWHVRINGKAPRIQAVVGKLEGIRQAMESFVQTLRTYYAQSS